METMKNETTYQILAFQMDLLFESICDEFSLESDEMSPELQDRLDKCADELLDILEKFVAQNEV